MSASSLIAHFQIPGKPIPKARARVTHLHTYTPIRTKEAEAQVQLYALPFREAFEKVKGQPLKLKVEFYFKGKVESSVPFSFHTQRPDLDNLVKTLTDGLRDYIEDATFACIEAAKYRGPEEKTEVWIYKLEEVVYV